MAEVHQVDQVPAGQPLYQLHLAEVHQVDQVPAGQPLYQLHLAAVDKVDILHELLIAFQFLSTCVDYTVYRKDFDCTCDIYNNRHAKLGIVNTIFNGVNINCEHLF